LSIAYCRQYELVKEAAILASLDVRRYSGRFLEVNVHGFFTMTTMTMT
jgi:hypothetical protein